jgi:ADP-ribosylglycohydrolase
MKYLNKKIILIAAIIAMVVIYFVAKQSNNYNTITAIEINITTTDSLQENKTFNFKINRVKKHLKTKITTQKKQEIVTNKISEEKIKEIYALITNNKKILDTVNVPIIVTRNNSSQYFNANNKEQLLLKIQEQTKN